MPPLETDRRTLLRTLSSAGLLALAGCSGDDESTTATGTTESDGATDQPPAESPTEQPTADTTTEPSETGTPTETDVAALEQNARELVTDWSNGDYEAMREPFTQRMENAISTERLDQLWTGITDSRGQFVTITETAHTTNQGFDVITVTARFSEGSQQFTVSFDDEGRVAGLRALPPQGSYEPPSYVDEAAFSEQERTIQASGDCSLGATLSLPDGDGSVPGVVLVHGSGAHNRDETIGPNKVFKDLAWGLASQGIAVLRYDKRTAACETDPTELTLDSLVTDDALSAVEVLRAEDRVESDDVVVAGHSLGGMVAPRIAARDGNLAGIAMLAAPARPLPDLVVEQNQYIVNLDGEVSDTEQEYLADIEAKMDRVRDLDLGPDETIIGKGRAWWESLKNYDQVATAEGLSLPMYFLQGSRDYQVDPEADYGRWLQTLNRRDAVQFEQYPRLDHLFMAGSGKSRPADYFEQDNVAGTVVTDLATWVDGVAE